MQRVHASVLSLAFAALAGVLVLAAPGATASRAAGVHATPRAASSYPLATIPVKPGSSQPNADPQATLALAGQVTKGCSRSWSCSPAAI